MLSPWSAVTTKKSNQKIGGTGDGHGDQDPLLHPPAHWVGVVVHPRLCVGDAHRAKELDRPLQSLSSIQALVDAKRLRDLIAHGEDGVQRRGTDSESFSVIRPALLMRPSRS